MAAEMRTAMAAVEMRAAMAAAVHATICGAVTVGGPA